MNRIILIFIIITLLFGCSQPLSNTDMASQSAENFLKILYTNSDYASMEISGQKDIDRILFEFENSISPYVTANMLEEMRSNREALRIADAMSENKITLQVLKITLSNITASDEQVYLDFEVEIIATNQSGATKTVYKTGKFKCIKEGDGFKVDHMKSITFPFDNFSIIK